VGIGRDQGQATGHKLGDSRGVLSEHRQWVLGSGCLAPPETAGGPAWLPGLGRHGGERSTLVVFWKQQEITNNDGAEEVTRTIPLLRYYLGFEVAQWDGLTLPPARVNDI